MEPPSSPFLTRFPVELRLSIYELIFAHPTGAPIVVDLCNANPPKKDILLACRQTYNESHALYVSSFRSFWRTSSFMAMRFDSSQTIAIQLSDLREIDLQHIRHLELVRREDPGTTMFVLVDVKGAWKFTGYSGTDYRLIVPFMSPWSEPLRIGIRGLSIFEDEETMRMAMEREKDAVGMKEQIRMLMGVEDAEDDEYA